MSCFQEFAQPKQGIPSVLVLAWEWLKIGSVCSGTSRQRKRAGWMQVLIRMTLGDIWLGQHEKQELQNLFLWSVSKASNLRKNIKKNIKKELISINTLRDSACFGMVHTLSKFTQKWPSSYTM